MSPAPLPLFAATLLAILGLPGPSAACDLPPGERQLVLEVGGIRREALVVVGKAVLPRNRPAVLFAWHGWGGAPEYLAKKVEPDKHWSDALVVLPRGLPRTLAELDPRFKGPANPGWQILAGEHGDRDLALFDALLAELERRRCVDPRRVYSTGFSNGGFFTNLLGCVRGARLAAAAAHAGGGPFPMTGQSCSRPTPPMMILHGLGDRVVPLTQAHRSRQHWEDHLGCRSSGPRWTAGCTESTHCRSGALRLCLFDGAHQWQEQDGALVARFLRRYQR